MNFTDKEYNAFIEGFCKALNGRFFKNSRSDDGRIIHLTERDGELLPDGRLLAIVQRFFGSEICIELQDLPASHYRCTVLIYKDEQGKNRFECFENYIGDGPDDQIIIKKSFRLAVVMKAALAYQPSYLTIEDETDRQGKD